MKRETVVYKGKTYPFEIGNKVRMICLETDSEHNQGGICFYISYMKGVDHILKEDPKYLMPLYTVVYLNKSSKGISLKEAYETLKSFTDPHDFSDIDYQDIIIL